MKGVGFGPPCSGILRKIDIAFPKLLQQQSTVVKFVTFYVKFLQMLSSKNYLNRLIFTSLFKY